MTVPDARPAGERGPVTEREVSGLSQDELWAGHRWLAPGEGKNTSRWTCCALCGFVRREDGRPQRPCKGRQPVTLRERDGRMCADPDCPDWEMPHAPHKPLTFGEHEVEPRTLRDVLNAPTRAVPVDHPGIEHDGCRYLAPVLRIEGCGDFWFCGKCGQGDEVFPTGGEP